MRSVSIPAKVQRLGGRVNAVMDNSRRRFYTFLAGLSTAAVATAPTFCAPANMKTLFNKMADIIYDIALYIGAAILLYGIVSWIMAMKDENPEGQSRAIRYAIVGITLVCIKVIAQPIINSVIS